MSGPVRWAVLTGEYPPQPGGVGDYARLVAARLAAAGDRVAVYAPPAAGPPPADPGVEVRRLPDHFGPRGLAALDRALRAAPRADRLLVQYVPHAFGRKAMNLPFAAWLAASARRLPPASVMFHEVAFPWVRRPRRHNLVAAATRVMARLAAAAADRVFVSIPAWGGLLRRLAPAAPPAEWLPVPSTVRAEPPAGAVERVRERYGRAGGLLVGHFGTYGGLITPLLGATLPALLAADPGRAVLLLGRGAEGFAADLGRRHPALAARVHGVGGLPPDELVAHLRACDWLYQPFPDGASGRRTSLMAGLGEGRPIVTNAGPLSEPIWRDTRCVALAPSADPAGLAAAADAAFRSPPAARDALAGRAAAVYAATFAVERTVAALRGPPGRRERYRERETAAGSADAPGFPHDPGVEAASD